MSSLHCNRIYHQCQLPHQISYNHLASQEETTKMNKFKQKRLNIESLPRYSHSENSPRQMSDTAPPIFADCGLRPFPETMK